jgi:hypothetical protein
VLGAALLLSLAAAVLAAAGVGGALSGVVMPARPRPGKPYRQEYLPGGRGHGPGPLTRP